MPPLESKKHLAILGAGFSGTLLAINVLRHGGPHVSLIERRIDQLGKGVAYSAADPSHLLNVRAANMSAFPDDPGHFVRWLENRNSAIQAGTHNFISRNIYGAYVSELLDAARAGAGDRLSVIHAEATAVTRSDAGYRVDLQGCAPLHADTVALSVGNLPPHSPPAIDPAILPKGSYVADPWAADIGKGLGPDDTIVLIGTGLTAIDAILLLDRQGFQGRIVAMSRRGLVPRAHMGKGPTATGRSDKPQGSLSRQVGEIRARAEQIGWHAAIDELRPVTQSIWGAANVETRGRFLRHLRPYWNVHRHRLAPEVADNIQRLRGGGRLHFLAGKVVAVEQDGDAIDLRWRPRHETSSQTMRVKRIVNCTGPQGDLLRTTDPLLKQLMASGQIRPDPMQLGIDVDVSSAIIDADGAAQRNLLCIGPMTRGGMWEVVAVPDLRRQAWDLARRLSNAHWEGGEGL